MWVSVIVKGVYELWINIVFFISVLMFNHSINANEDRVEYVDVVININCDGFASI